MTSTKRHVCAVCGRHEKAERMTFSKWTRNRYCIDLKPCRARAKRRQSREAVAVA